MITLKQKRRIKKIKPLKIKDNTYYSDIAVLKHFVALSKKARDGENEPITLANFYFKDEISRHCFNYLFYYCRNAQIVIKKATTPTIIKPYAFIDTFIEEYNEADYLSIVFLAIAETKKLKYYTDKQKHRRNKEMVAIIRNECRAALNYKKVVYQRFEPLSVNKEGEDELSALDLLSNDGGIDNLLNRLYLQELLENLTVGERKELARYVLEGRKATHITRIRKKINKNIAKTHDV